VTERLQVSFVPKEREIAAVRNAMIDIDGPITAVTNRLRSEHASAQAAPARRSIERAHRGIRPHRVTKRIMLAAVPMRD